MRNFATISPTQPTGRRRTLCLQEDGVRNRALPDGSINHLCLVAVGPQAQIGAAAQRGCRGCTLCSSPCSASRRASSSGTGTSLKSGWAAENAFSRPRPSFSSGRMPCRWRTPADRPSSPAGPSWSNGNLLPAIRPSAGFCRHFRSGLRRRVPRPEHGASAPARIHLACRRLMRSIALVGNGATGWMFDRPLQASRGLQGIEAVGRYVKGVKPPGAAHHGPDGQGFAPAPAQSRSPFRRVISSNEASSCEPSSPAPPVSRHECRRLVECAACPSRWIPQG